MKLLCSIYKVKYLLILLVFVDTQKEIIYTYFIEKEVFIKMQDIIIVRGDYEQGY